MEQGKATQRKKIKRRISGCLICLYVIFSIVVFTQGKWDVVFSLCNLTEKPESDLPFTVRVFSVGSADCILLQNEDHAMLIDAATADLGIEIAQTLHRLGVEQLDYVIATHPHDDHIGGLSEILTRIPARQALISPMQSLKNMDSYRQLCAIFDKHSVPVHVSVAGECFYFADRAKIQILSAGVPSENQNEASLVIRITYGNISMLFMGDGETESEESLLTSKTTLQSDFIKLGHHGSKTSSSLRFLQAVSPSYVAVSCGEASEIAEETLLNLDEMGLKAYRTDLNGTLLFATDGTLCEMKCAEDQ